MYPALHFWQWHRLSFRKVAYIVLCIYLLITCYTTFRLLNRKLQAEIKDKKLLERIKSLAEIADDPDWNPWGEEFESEQQPQRRHVAPALWEALPLNANDAPLPVGKRSPLEGKENDVSHVVEIWGKAAIGLYLWEHILEGQLEPRMGGAWSFGERTIGAVTFRFRTGPGVVPGQVPQDTENLLLVLNGREPSKVEASKAWLDYLPSLPRLRNVAVLLLGNEMCNNAWIHPYLALHGGVVRCIFLVYDSPEVDNVNFFQWPLGVATYREFPVVDPAKLPLSHKRPYIFNFLGTVYKNSSRESLLAAVNGSMYRHVAYVKPRLEWLPQETAKTRDEYVRVLSHSDLTLNPVGMNTECYRIYEALALGSVPVLEDVMTPGFCGDRPGLSQQELFSDKNPNILALPAQTQNHDIFRRNYSAPLRLLKEFDAPVIFIKDWAAEMEEVLKRESRMSDLDIVKRREHVIQWYGKFKAGMRERLVFVLLEKFFSFKAR